MLKSMRISRFSQMFLLLMVSGWGTVWAAPEKSLDASISQQSAKLPLKVQLSMLKVSR